MDFGRILTAMVTPFDRQGNIDWNQTERLIDYLIEEQQSDSLIIAGTTGESATLSEEEKLSLFEFSLEKAAGRCPIIAGTGSNNTAHTLQLTQKAKEIGVDGVLLVAPYYNRPTQEGLYRHFQAVAEGTDIPIILYNVPARSGVNLQAETTIRLSQISNIVAVKESSGDLCQMGRIIAGTDDAFVLYSGDDSLSLPVLAIGGYGVVSVSSHIVGKEMQDMIRFFVEGDTAQAARIHRQLLPIFQGLFTYPSPGPVKSALRIKGIEVGGLRLPMIELNEQEEQYVRNLLS